MLTLGKRWPIHPVVGSCDPAVRFLLQHLNGTVQCITAIEKADNKEGGEFAMVETIERRRVDLGN